jgi:CRISPR/Cas system-associated exonuclease Cas4 (RecB family)
MAKPHRMWLMGIALVVAAVATPWQNPILVGTAVIIAIGSALTCITRTRAVAARLRTNSA